MFGHWYIVADQRIANIYTEVPRTSGVRSVKNFKLIKAIENPLGTTKTRDLLHQEKGMGVKSLGHHGIAARYAETKRRDPHEEAAEQFAKEVVIFLQKERIKKSFQDLTIVAEPHFIGKLRSAMDRRIQNCVARWVRKDLQHVTRSRLADILTKS